MSAGVFAASLWIAFGTLTALEIVLGVDNLIFVSILVGRLPPPRQRRARLIGLALAMITRLVLLTLVVGLTRLTRPLFHIAEQAVSARDVVLAVGGLFLLAKGALEIHHTLEAAALPRATRDHASEWAIVLQIAAFDIVFSLDSVFTAVGLANDLPVMIAAIVVAIAVMMWLSGKVSAFIERHPSIKVLALSFLLLIGCALTAEAAHFDIPKGYLYFAMAFATGVEMINVRLRDLLRRHR